MDFQRLLKDGDNMSQEFSQLNVHEAVNVTIPKMQKSIEAVASNFSGTSFPTENLFTGQFFFDESGKCLYELVDATAVTKNWVCVADLKRNIANADTAKKLAKTFNIKLIGAVTGNVDADGSAAITLNSELTVATSTEMRTGTNNTKPVTPKLTKDTYVSNLAGYVSSGSIDDIWKGGYYSIVSTVGNNPESSQGFLEVIPNNTEASTSSQIFHGIASGKTWVRTSYLNSSGAMVWPAWKQLATIDDIPSKDIQDTINDIKTLDKKIDDIDIIGTELTVTGSTQANVNPSMSGSFTTAEKITLPNVVSGIGATTTTLKNLLQLLVNKSHSHQGKTINGSNCNCNCNCDNSCFIAGSKVLVFFEGAYRFINIELVKAGDLLVGANGQLNKVLCPYVVKLGDYRAMLKTVEKKPLVFAADHEFWIKQGNEEYWGVFDYNTMLRAENTILPNGLSLSQTVQLEAFKRHKITPCVAKGFTKKLPFAVYSNFEFGTINGWKRVPVKQAREYDGDTTLYSFIMAGNHTFFVNGYLVTGFGDDTDFDYSSIKIEPLACAKGVIVGD